MCQKYHCGLKDCQKLHGKKLKETMAESRMNDLKAFENTRENHLLIGIPEACLQRDYNSKTWNYIPISRNPSLALNRECLEYYILLNCPYAKNEAMNGVRVFQGEWP